MKSSSDDIWFLDEEDVESDQDPPFMEEYEVVSEHSSPSNSLSDQTDTSDPGIKQVRTPSMLIFASVSVSEVWARMTCQGFQLLWKSGKALKMSFQFSSQGKLREFGKNTKNQGKLRESVTVSQKGKVFASLRYVCLLPCVQVVFID